MSGGARRVGQALMALGGLAFVAAVAATVFGVAIFQMLAPAGLGLLALAIGAALAGPAGGGEASPIRLFVGRLLMAAGLLIATLCGVCALTFMAIFAGSVYRGERAYLTPTDWLGAVLVPLETAALPILFGLAMFGVGRMVARGGARPKQSNP